MKEQGALHNVWRDLSAEERRMFAVIYRDCSATEDPEQPAVRTREVLMRQFEDIPLRERIMQDLLERGLIVERKVGDELRRLGEMGSEEAVILRRRLLQGGERAQEIYRTKAVMLSKKGMALGDEFGELLYMFYGENNKTK